MNTTVTLEYDSKNDSLKQVLQLFVTLGGNIINVENDDDLNDTEFLEKIKRGQEESIKKTGLSIRFLMIEF